jgi:hypothetical protein
MYESKVAAPCMLRLRFESLAWLAGAEIYGCTGV